MRCAIIDAGHPAVSCRCGVGEIRACLSDDFDMEHRTIQLETSDRRRLEEASHA